MSHNAATIVGLYEDGVQTGIRVEDADPVILLDGSLVEMLRDDALPWVSLTPEGKLTIDATNGTWTYQLSRRADDGVGWWAEQVEAPGARA